MGLTPAGGAIFGRGVLPDMIFMSLIAARFPPMWHVCMLCTKLCLIVVGVACCVLALVLMYIYVCIYDQGEPAVSYRRTGWV